MDARRLFGDKAERQAARFLKEKGMTILARQFQTRFGEIDLIARDGDEIVFVEVKARRSDAFGAPEESVTQAKLKRIAAVGEQFLDQKALSHLLFRIDVVEIVTEPRLEVRHIVGVGG